jgi:hypothetical protein
MDAYEDDMEVFGEEEEEAAASAAAAAAAAAASSKKSKRMSLTLTGFDSATTDTDADAEGHGGKPRLQAAHSTSSIASTGSLALSDDGRELALAAFPNLNLRRATPPPEPSEDDDLEGFGWGDEEDEDEDLGEGEGGERGPFEAEEQPAGFGLDNLRNNTASGSPAPVMANKNAPAQLKEIGSPARDAVVRTPSPTPTDSEEEIGEPARDEDVRTPPPSEDQEEERRVYFERARPEDIALVTARPERRRSDAWRFGSIRGAAQRAGQNVRPKASAFRKWTDWVNAVEGIDTSDVGVEGGGGAGERLAKPAQASTFEYLSISFAFLGQCRSDGTAARHSENGQEDAQTGETLAFCFACSHFFCGRPPPPAHPHPTLPHPVLL